ncbi:hypothetical protein GE21DRAFT_1291415 [Neurospora crassa]|nr:hypothetical protein GE21DRAFT_1291415 [Neurospora crassa]
MAELICKGERLFPRPLTGDAGFQPDGHTSKCQHFCPACPPISQGRAHRHKPQAPKAVHTRNHRGSMEKRWENEGPRGQTNRPDGQLQSRLSASLFKLSGGWRTC